MSVERASAWGRPSLIALCGVALLGSLLRLLGVPVPAALLLLVGAGVLALVGAGVALLGSGVFARPILGVTPSQARDRFALTFDDGPDPACTPRILDLLEAAGHRGTFFVIGARVDAHPALVAEIARRGHAVENHSHGHPRYATLGSAGAFADDLLRAQASIERASGTRPRYLRPPVGLLSPPIVVAAARADLELVGWSETARDGTARATVQSAAARLLGALRPGAILVLHDGAERGERRPIAEAVLVRILDEAGRRGLRSVPLGELCAADG